MHTLQITYLSVVKKLLCPTKLLCAIWLTSALSAGAAAAGVDYDGNGFSEIPVLTTDANGSFVWSLFDPFSTRTTVFTSAFGTPADHLILANWIYPKITSARIVSAPNQSSQGRLVWRIRTMQQSGPRKSRQRVRRTASRTPVGALREQVKYLGRSGDIVITGGDYTGDQIADAVVITDRGTGKYKWGLRGNFFLASYNPTLKINRAYFDFGTIGLDRPFFLNPDGKSDWFAIVRDLGDGRQEIAYTQPFTQELRSFQVDSVSAPGGVPVPVAQDDGHDLLLFHSLAGDSTQLVVKDLAGRTISEVTIPLSGDITIGNYGPGPGEEIAVGHQGLFYIYNPITQRLLSINGPVGHSVDSINIDTVQ